MRSTPSRPRTTTALLWRKSLVWTSTSSPTGLSTVSLARARGAEQRVQLIERLGHPGRRPGGDRSVERVLRGIEVVDDHARPAARLLECHRRDLPTLIAFVIGPDQPRRWGRFV